MKNKRGLELAISTVVIIVLSVLVLIALIFIFTQEKGFFSDLLGNIGGKTNVDSLVVSCNSLVTQQMIHEFCCVKRNVRYESKGEIVKEQATCKELSEKDFIVQRIQILGCKDAVC